MRSTVLLLLGFSISSTFASISTPGASIFRRDGLGLLVPRHEEGECNNQKDIQCTLTNPPEGQPDKYCCPETSSCINLAKGSAGICCKAGEICARVMSITCSSTDSIRQTQERCGPVEGQCCPTFYSCRTGICVLKEENWEGLPESWLEVAKLGSMQLRNCTEEVMVAVAKTKSEEEQYPMKAIFIGLFPGLAGGAFIMFIICYAFQLRKKRKMYQRESDPRYQEHKLMDFPAPKSVDSRATSRTTNTTLHQTRSHTLTPATTHSRHPQSHQSPASGPRRNISQQVRSPPSAVIEESISRSHGPSPHPSQTSHRSPAGRAQIPVIRHTPPLPSAAAHPQALHEHPNLPGLYVPNPQSARTSVSDSSESSTTSFQESTISRTQAHNEYLFAQHNSSAPPLPHIAYSMTSSLRSPQSGGLQPVPMVFGNPGDVNSVVTDSDEFAGVVQERRRLENAYRLSAAPDRWAKEKAPKPGSSQ